MDTGAPLGGHSGRHEHLIVVGYSAAGAFASHQHYIFDIARAFLAGLSLSAKLFSWRRMGLALPATHASNSPHSPRCFWPWSPCFW
jgi:hypothetical protein